MNALLQYLAGLDTYTWFCFLAMAMFGASLVSSQLESWMMSLLYFPGLVAGQLAFHALLQHYAVAFVVDKAVNTIIVAGVGAIISLLVLVVMSRLVLAVLALLSPAPRRDDLAMDNLVRRRI